MSARTRRAHAQPADPSVAELCSMELTETKKARLKQAAVAMYQSLNEDDLILIPPDLVKLINGNNEARDLIENHVLEAVKQLPQDDKDKFFKLYKNIRWSGSVVLNANLPTGLPRLDL